MNRNEYPNSTVWKNLCRMYELPDYKKQAEFLSTLYKILVANKASSMNWLSIVDITIIKQKDEIITIYSLKKYMYDLSEIIFLYRNNI